MGVLSAIVYFLALQPGSIPIEGIPPNSACIVYGPSSNTNWPYMAECWNRKTGEHIGEFFLTKRPEGLKT